MCGGFTVSRSVGKFEKILGSGLESGVFIPSFNARPGQDLPIVVKDGFGDGGVRSENVVGSIGHDFAPKMVLGHWGIKTDWSGFSGKSPVLMNTRIESLNKPFFKRLLAGGRCLIVVDGFYEWHLEGRVKQPYLFTVNEYADSEKALCLAGIYSVVESGGKVGGGENLGGAENVVIQFSIITVPANGVMLPIHDRMPVVLDSVLGLNWLDGAVSDVSKVSMILGDNLNDRLSYSKVSLK